MKFLHLSDLHLGKRVNEFSMLGEQEAVLGQITDIVARERPDAVVIAGDVYDKPVPPVEAVKLLDGFLRALTQRGIKILMISGNHDSAERLSFLAGILGGSGIFIAPAFGGSVAPVTLEDGFGKVNFYLLPFIKPVNVSRAFPEEGVEDYTSALRAAITHMSVDFSARNVLVTHQFVTGAERSESEELSVGGTDNVDGSVFAGFDYVALGHIHAPQNVGSPVVRYCGTPLKYSFSECSQKKSVTVVEMGEKGSVEVRTVPLVPVRDFVALRGTYAEVTQKSYLEKLNTEDYYKITLTDEDMALEYDNSRTRAGESASDGGDVRGKTPSELFGELYEKQNGRPMTEEMARYMEDLIEKVWGEGDE